MVIFQIFPNQKTRPIDALEITSVKFEENTFFFGKKISDKEKCDGYCKFCRQSCPNSKKLNVCIDINDMFRKKQWLGCLPIPASNHNISFVTNFSKQYIQTLSSGLFAP